MVVAPGFIDMLGQSETYLLIDPRAMSKVMMGVTTEVTGEGESIAPVNERLIKEQEDFQSSLQPDRRLAHARRIFQATREARHRRQSRHLRGRDADARIRGRLSTIGRQLPPSWNK